MEPDIFPLELNGQSVLGGPDDFLSSNDQEIPLFEQGDNLQPPPIISPYSYDGGPISAPYFNSQFAFSFNQFQDLDQYGYDQTMANHGFQYYGLNSSFQYLPTLDFGSTALGNASTMTENPPSLQYTTDPNLHYDSLTPDKGHVSESPHTQCGSFHGPDALDPSELRPRQKAKRTHISTEAKDVLETSFSLNPYPSDGVVSMLATRTGLPENTVKTWFANSRARKETLYREACLVLETQWD